MHDALGLRPQQVPVREVPDGHVHVLLARCPRTLEVRKTPGEEEVVPAGDDVHGGDGPLEVAEHVAVAPKDAIRARVLERVLEEGDAMAGEHHVQIGHGQRAERLVGQALQEPGDAVLGEVVGRAQSREQPQHEVEPEHDELERDAAAGQEAGATHAALGHDGHDEVHLGALLAAGAGPGREAEVGDAEDGELAVVPGLLLDPRDGGGAVLDLRLHGHEGAAGAEAAARVLHEHREAALDQQLLPKVQAAAVGRAHEHRGEGARLTGRREQRRTQHVAGARRRRIEILLDHLVPWRRQVQRARPEPRCEGGKAEITAPVVKPHLRERVVEDEAEDERLRHDGEGACGHAQRHGVPKAEGRRGRAYEHEQSESDADLKGHAAPREGAPQDARLKLAVHARCPGRPQAPQGLASPG
mmetsp:Transcript_11872/g.35998  ORF Transcript_11872/g.35998 Transcript_11872/m.35998 type:complete len:414 (-) Transcript_11872:212-1453(-)